MKKSKASSRRSFLKKASLSTIPFLAPAMAFSKPDLLSSDFSPKENEKPLLNFISDGLFFSPTEYLQKLQEINTTNPIQADFYGNGGATKALEEAFAKLTGKEKAIFLPTGTMANQLAIKILAGENTKVMVPENSHIFRDEGDAAQEVHGKRLIPVGKDKPYFDRKDLEQAIDYLNAGEVFKSGLGVIAVEHPIRRADGVAVPIQIMRDLSKFSKERGYKLHLDGARIHIAAAFTGVSVAEIASHFDTVYISLYKYLNASGGAMLCGDRIVIDKMVHQMKVLGGTGYQSWNETAMALHYLDGIEERWKVVVERARVLFAKLNDRDDVKITGVTEGTNIFDLKFGRQIDLKKFAGIMNEEYNIWFRRPNEKGLVKLFVNESLLSREVDDVFSAWNKALEKAKK